MYFIELKIYAYYIELIEFYYLFISYFWGNVGRKILNSYPFKSYFSVESYIRLDLEKNR